MALLKLTSGVARLVRSEEKRVELQVELLQRPQSSFQANFWASNDPSALRSLAGGSPVGDAWASASNGLPQGSRRSMAG